MATLSTIDTASSLTEIDFLPFFRFYYVLLEGNAYAFIADDDGNEFIVASVGKHDCFGELGLLDCQMRTARITHQELANCLAFSGEMISKILKELRLGGYMSVTNHCAQVHKELLERS